MTQPTTSNPTRRGGRRLHNALNERAVRAAKRPGRYFDGQGLFLLVEPTGAKRWKQRLTRQGRRHELGLGPYPVVTLAMARSAALANRRMVHAGGDPLAEKRRARGAPTFAEAARKVFELRRDGWRNAKHADQWITTLEQFVFPTIGARGVHEISTEDLIAALGPIWHTKPTTAKRVLQRIGAVFAWAVANKERPDNPADAVKAVLPKHNGAGNAHRALPYSEVAGAIAAVRASSADACTKLAFEFTVLTAARAGEVRWATWTEIGLEAATWTVPASRMKAGREHRMPLPPRAPRSCSLSHWTLLRAARLGFPGACRGRPLPLLRLPRESARPALPRPALPWRDARALPTVFRRRLPCRALAVRGSWAASGAMTGRAIGFAAIMPDVARACSASRTRD